MIFLLIAMDNIYIFCIVKIIYVYKFKDGIIITGRPEEHTLSFGYGQDGILVNILYTIYLFNSWYNTNRTYSITMQMVKANKVQMIIRVA